MGYRASTDDFVVYGRLASGGWNVVSNMLGKTAHRIKSMVTVSRPNSEFYYFKDRTKNITQEIFILLHNPFLSIS